MTECNEGHITARQLAPPPALVAARQLAPPPALVVARQLAPPSHHRVVALQLYYYYMDVDFWLGLDLTGSASPAFVGMIM